MKLHLLLLLAFVSCQLSRAGTITNTVVHPIGVDPWEQRAATVNWSQPATIPGFELAGQQLDSVTVTLHSYTVFAFAGENTAPTPSSETLLVWITGAFTAGGSTVTLPAVHSSVTTTPAFDGVVDRAGASGIGLRIEATHDAVYSMAPGPFRTAGLIPVVLSDSGSVEETGGAGIPDDVYGYGQCYLGATIVYTYSEARRECDDDRDDDHSHGHGHDRDEHSRRH